MISTLTKGRTFNYFRYKCKSHKTHLITTSIMCTLTYPLFFIVLALTYSMDENIFSSFISSALSISILAMCVYMFMGIIIPTTTTPYLHQRTMTDLGFSIPLNSKQRFWGDYLSGLFIYIIPHIISIVIGILLYTFTYYNDTKEILSELSPSVLLSYMITALVISIMLYILTHLISVFTGNSGIAKIYAIIINIIIPIALALISWAIFTSVYGADYEDIIQKVITSSSPIGLIVGTILNMVNISSEGLVVSYLFNWDVFLPIVLIFGCVVVVTYYVYKNRKAEQTGSPFAFKSIYNFILFLIMFTIVSGFATITRETEGDYQSSLFMSMMVTSFIAFVVLDVMTRRDFTKFWQSIIKYLGMVFGSFAIISVIFMFDGFGMTYIVPEVSQVSSVNIEYSSRYKIMSGYYRYSSSDFNDVKINTKDEEVIKSAVDIHQKLVDEYSYSNEEERSNLKNSYSNFKITYKLKSGGVITRNYTVYEDSFKQQLDTIYSSKAYNEFKANTIYNTITKTGYSAVKELYITSLIGMENYSSRMVVSKSNYRDIANALKLDIIENDENPNLDNEKIGYIFITNSSGLSDYIPIKSYYANTISIIENLGGSNLLNKKISDSISGKGTIEIYDNNSSSSVIVDFQDISNDLGKIIDNSSVYYSKVNSNRFEIRVGDVYPLMLIPNNEDESDLLKIFQEYYKDNQYYDEEVYEDIIDDDYYKTEYYY